MVNIFNLRTVAMLSCFLLASLCSKAQQNVFTLTLKPTVAMPTYKVFLYYKKGPGNINVDSAAFLDGKFQIRSQVPGPQRAVLYVERSNSGFGSGTVKTVPGTIVYLEAGNILLSSRDGFKTVRRSGTPLNTDYQQFTDAIQPFAEKEAVILAKNKEAVKYDNINAEKVLGEEYSQLLRERRKVEEDFFNKHLNSPIAFEWLKKSYNVQQEKSKVLAMFNKMGDSIKNSPSGKSFGSLLQSTVSVEIGKQALDFSAKTIQGEEIALNSFRGKYVLLDFWASWCGPCRRENPNVLKAYHKYKSKNFTVLAFSFDENKTAWTKAVAQDGLPWTQISDLAGFNSRVSSLYGVTSIPSNFLLDPSGKIIARDLRGDDLEKALNKFLK